MGLGNHISSGMTQFDLDRQLSLHWKSGEKTDQYLRLLEYRIRHNPQDLLRHVQRIFQFLELEKQEQLLGALTDLFVALGEHGRALRTRMLATARPYISSQDFEYFSIFVKLGMHPCQARYSRYSSLSAGYEPDNLSAGCQYTRDAESAQDSVLRAEGFLQQGLMDRAQSVLEETLIRNPLNAEAERVLLNLYHQNQDQLAYERMGLRLQQARTSLSEKWRGLKQSFGHGQLRSTILESGE